MDKEAFVEIGGSIRFPFFGCGHIHLVGEDLAFVGSDEVEQEPEQGRFAGAVIADEPDELACLEGQGRDIDDDIAVIGFDEVVDRYHGCFFGMGLSFSEALQDQVFSFVEFPGEEGDPPVAEEEADQTQDAEGGDADPGKAG